MTSPACLYGRGCCWPEVVWCGLLMAAGATRLLRSLLFHVSPLDPVTYGCGVVALCGAAVLASYIPSRRTASVNPAEALRAE